MRVVAERRVHKAEEAFHGGSGSGEHDEGESDLGGSEEAVGSASVGDAGDLAGTGLHDLADFRAREPKGGPEAEDDSGKDGDGYAEDQDRKVDLNGGFVRKRIFRKQRDHDGERAVGEENAEGGASERE